MKRWIPFTNLTLESLEFNGNIIEVEIGLRHPFLGLNEFTGFDVCGILRTGGTVSGFDDPHMIMAGDGDTHLLNPDGWARAVGVSSDEFSGYVKNGISQVNRFVDVLRMLRSEGTIVEDVVVQMEGGVEDTPRLAYSLP